MDEKTTTDASGNQDGNPGCTFRDLVAVCPEYAERGGWEGLQPCEWVEILSGHPEFADRCDWAKLDGEDWVNLLTARPGFADKCDWESIAKPLDDFCGELWPDFLSSCPQFADRCPKVDFPLAGIPPKAILGLLSKDPGAVVWGEDSDLSTLSASDWSELLNRHPMLAIRCKKELFAADDWKTLLGKHPFLSDDETKTGHLWNVLSAACPGPAGKGDWANLSDDDWTEILLKFPMLEKLYGGWENLSAPNWVELISAQHWFEKKCYECGGYGKFSGDDWVRILEEAPSAEDACTEFHGWRAIDCNGWLELIRWSKESKWNALQFGHYFFDHLPDGRRYELATEYEEELNEIDPDEDWWDLLNGD